MDKMYVEDVYVMYHIGTKGFLSYDNVTIFCL